MSLRRLIFWIHLCCGIALAVWVALIGSTGAIVVFQDEITRSQFMKFPGSNETRIEARIHGPAGVALRAYQRFPDFQPITVTWPNEYCPFFMTYLIRGREGVEVYSNVRTGEIAGTLNPKGGWLGTLHGWHVSLWGGRSGRIVNGYASIALMLLSITGIVLWLPKRQWRIRWREIHYATGIVSAAFILMFAATAAYFVWPSFFVTRLATHHDPVLDDKHQQIVSLDHLAEVARQAVPDAKLHRLQIVDRATFPVRVTMRRGSAAQFHLVDTVFLDPATAGVLRIDCYSARPAGESILAWFSALHFAAFGGIWGEIVWSIAGLSFPLLAVTGVVIWWRRVIRTNVPAAQRNPAEGAK